MSERSSARRLAPDLSRVLSRRNIFKGAVGVAAGAAGAAVMADGSSAHAATMGTTTESGALAPAVVMLTDAAAIAVDASLGNDYRVTIAGDRTMQTPANPTDGQKITFQVTQGTGGSFTLSWASGYVFSAALPQPTLSTTVGYTDLLGFIYNAAKQQWLFVAYVTGFSTPAGSSPSPSPSPSPTPTPPPSSPPPATGTYRLFAATNGPASAVSYSGPFIAGVAFEVTTGGCWLDGYWWWVCPSGQSVSAQEFALWAVYGTGEGTLVASGTVTSGGLIAGQWNYVSLATPLPLAIGATYIAATGFSGGFPDTNGQFGSGDPYSAGIVNGPLTAFSDTTGSLPAPHGAAQGVFSVASSNPTVNMPFYGSSSSNFWLDVQVDTSPPAGTSYRLWPSYPTVVGGIDSDTTGYTLANEFRLSKSCTLDEIWFYSAPGAAALPTRCAIWNVSSQAVVSGTDNTSPSWSGAAGSGWVSCAYSGVTLPAGDYKVSVFYGGGSQWYQVAAGYWTTGSGGSGITSGPLTAPSAAAATSPGQATYNQASWAYPATNGNGENFWVDVQVTPAT
jgi:hypothetical protein